MITSNDNKAIQQEVQHALEKRFIKQKKKSMKKIKKNKKDKSNAQFKIQYEIIPVNPPMMAQMPGAMAQMPNTMAQMPNTMAQMQGALSQMPGVMGQMPGTINFGGNMMPQVISP